MVHVQSCSTSFALTSCEYGYYLAISTHILTPSNCGEGEYLRSFTKVCPKYREVYDILSETSPVPASALRSFEPLHWSISPRVATDIQIAVTNIDR